MPNERLSLLIDGKVSGQAAIDALAASLNKVVDISSRVGQRQGSSSAPTTGFENFSSQIKQLVQDPLAGAESVIKSFAGSFGPIGVAVGGTIGVLGAFAGASFAAAKSLAAIGVEYQNVSLRTGLTTKEVALFGYTAQSTGQDVGIFETAMRKLSAGLADAGGAGKKTRDALDELGVKTRDVDGHIRPTGEIFRQMSIGLNAITEPAKRDALAIELLGRSGIVALPALLKLNDELARGEKLNFAPTDAEIWKFKQYNQEITDIGALWAKVKREFQEGIVGSITLKVFKELLSLGASGPPPKTPIEGAHSGTIDTFMKRPNLAGRDPWDLVPEWTAVTGGPRQPEQTYRAKPLDVMGYFMSHSPEVPSQKGAEDIAAYLKSSGGVPAIEAQLQEAKGKSADARAEVESNKNTASTETAGKLIAESKKADAKVEYLTAVLKEFNTRDEAIKQFANMLKAMAANKDESELEKLKTQYDSDIATLKTDKRLTPQRLDALTRTYQQQQARIGQDSVKGRDLTGIEAFAESSKMARTFGEETAKSFNEGLKDAENGINSNPMASLVSSLMDPKRWGPARQRTSEDLIKDAKAQSDQQQRLVEITGQPGDEVKTQQKLSDIKVNQAEKDLSYQKSLANAKIIDDQALFDAEVNYERTLFDIRSENTNKLAELRMAEMNREVDAVTGLFRAALGGGKGITDYVKSMAVGMGETVLSNFMKQSVLKPDASGGYSSIMPHFSEGSTAGNLFQNALFGPKRSGIGVITTSATSDAAKMFGGQDPGTVFTTSTTTFRTAVDIFADAVARSSGGPGAAGSGVGAGVSGLGNIPTDLGSIGNAAYSASGLSFGGIMSPGMGLGLPAGGLSAIAADLKSQSRSAQSYSGISGMIGGLRHTGDLQGIFTGVSSGPNGSESLSGSERIGAGIATAGVVIGGAEAAYSGFKKGGARGDLQGSAAILGTAAALDPEPVSKAVLAGVAMVTGLVTSMLGDPKQLRAEAINKTLGNAKYEAPTARDVSMGVSGGYSDYSAYGDVRGSNLGPYPTGVTQPSQYYRAGIYNPIPGSSGTPYGAPQMVVHIDGDVIDPQDFFNRNGVALGNTMANQFGTHTEMAIAATKATVGG